MNNDIRKITLDLDVTLLKEQLRNELKTELRTEIFRFVEGIGKEVIIEELRKIDIPLTLGNKLDILFKKRFEPIVKNAIDMTSIYMIKKINDKLKSIINLKTSTIMEIKSEFNKIPVETEEKTLKQLSIDFPEYFKEIEKQNQIENKEN